MYGIWPQAWMMEGADNTTRLLCLQKQFLLKFDANVVGGFINRGH